MSTGAEHYIESQRRLERAADFTDDSPERRNELLEAQVHATLALAAATALGSVRVDDHGMPPVDENAWLTAASADNIGHGDDPDDKPAGITEELVAERWSLSRTPKMAATSVEDQAAFVYDACSEIVVTPVDGDQWQVNDGAGGPLVATVPVAVLEYIDANYDMPVVTIDDTPFVS